MDQSLKNRLVGVAVLLALAAIVLPMLFDGANERALLADTRMPAPPVVPEADALLTEAPAQLPEAEEEMTRDHVPAEPEAVVVPPVAVAPPVAPAPATPAPAAPVQPTAAPATPVAVPVPAAAPKAEPRLAALAEAWDVQVAAVAAADGAERLRAKLAKAGYKARVYPANGLFKVVVGPELRRQDAEALRTKLAADARVGKPKGMLVRYVP